MKKNTGIPKTTFSSMSEDFVEARFDPAYKKEFQEKLDLFDRSKGSGSSDIPVTFFGEFDTKSRKAIQTLVREAVHYADMHRLTLTTSAQIAFFTSSAWQKERGRPTEGKIPLPSAKIEWQSGIPTVQLIVPGRITSSEVVIKTVRLLCSKLFGKLFFHECLPNKPAFGSLGLSQEKISFLLEEKARFCKLYDRFTEDYESEFTSISRKYCIHGPKSTELGKKEFFKELIKKKENADEHYIRLLDKIFDKTIDSAIESPKQFFQSATSRFFSLLEQTALILPHERRGFHHLVQTEQWTIFNTLAEKLSFVANYTGEVIDTYDFLAEVSSSNPIVHGTASLKQSTLRELMLRLKKRGLVKLFLIEGAKLTKKQKNERNTFPLWMWRNRLLGAADRLPPNDQIRRIANCYRNSIYQKLFEATFRFVSTIDRMKASDAIFLPKTPDFARMRSLVSWLKLRRDTLLDVLLGCQVAARIPVLAAGRDPANRDLLSRIERGWSYFVSFALIHQCYLKMKGRKEGDESKAETFYKVIENYVLKRIEKLPSFQLVALLMELYSQSRFDLTGIVKLVREESQAFDFFVLNQTRLFDKSNANPAEIIRNYSVGIRQWQSKRSENRITQNELDRISGPLRLSDLSSQKSG